MFHDPCFCDPADADQDALLATLEDLDLEAGKEWVHGGALDTEIDHDACDAVLAAKAVL
jgi:hypothetical protein